MYRAIDIQLGRVCAENEDSKTQSIKLTGWCMADDAGDTGSDASDAGPPGPRMGVTTYITTMCDVLADYYTRRLW